MDSDINCKDIITSEEYADFIVPRKYIVNTGNPLNAVCENVVNNSYEIVHVPVSQIEPLDSIAYGYSSIPKLYGLMDYNVANETGVTRVRNQPGLELTGTGILIGIIDTGIDYRHEAFVRENNTTKIVEIWDQSVSGDSIPQGFDYGSIYTREDINRALAGEEGVVPESDEIGHGTFLAGIAAGRENNREGFTGIAPNAAIAVVKLKPAKRYLRDFFLIAEDAVAYQENDIMMAVKYLTRLSDRESMPLSICVGLGTNSGEHLGLSPLESYLSDCGIAIGIGVSAAAGNESAKRHHYTGVMSRLQEYIDVEIEVGEGENGYTLELWADAPDTFEVGFISPVGDYVDRIVARTNQTSTINFALESTVVYVTYEIAEEASGKELIFMRFVRPTQGIWTIRVFAKDIITGRFNMWLPISEFITPGTYFLEAQNTNTITSPGNATVPITFGNYNPQTDSVYINSGRGFLEDGTIKPNLAAPGTNVLGPVRDNRYGKMTGTSVAAAVGAGCSALMLEWGILKGNNTLMNTLSIKNFFTRGAIRKDSLTYPNESWGYGKVNVYNTIDVLRGRE